MTETAVADSAPAMPPVEGQPLEFKPAVGWEYVGGKYVERKEITKTSPDMNDRPDLAADPKRWPLLRPALEVCHSVLWELYDEADQQSGKRQGWHKWITRGAAGAGGAAIIFAITELTPLEELFARNKSTLLAVLEVVFAIGAAVAVAYGRRRSFHESWLLERHRAERCRGLKFKALFEPALLREGADSTAWHAWLREQVAPLTEPDEKKWRRAMEAWIRQPYVEVPPKWSDLRVSEGLLCELIDYFKAKRINYQYNFFLRRGGEYERIDKWKRLPRYFFFLSIAAALLHFLTSLAKDAFEARNMHPLPYLLESKEVEHAQDVLFVKPHWWILLWLAAVLPAGGATIRTILSAGESSRHALRYPAHASGLDRHENRLTDAAAKLTRGSTRLVEAEEVERIMHDLWGSEQIMEAEHREWLRLMRDAEWYG